MARKRNIDVYDKTKGKFYGYIKRVVKTGGTRITTEHTVIIYGKEYSVRPAKAGRYRVSLPMTLIGKLDSHHNLY